MGSSDGPDFDVARARVGVVCGVNVVGAARPVFTASPAFTAFTASPVFTAFTAGRFSAGYRTARGRARAAPAASAAHLTHRRRAARGDQS